MKIQPTEIEKYLTEKGKKIFDDMGWTGEFKVSAKDIIDMLIDFESDGETPNETQQKCTLVDVSKCASDERKATLKGDYRQSYTDWKNKYFKQEIFIYEYISIANGLRYTTEELHEKYEKAMRESPFNGC